MTSSFTTRRNFEKPGNGDINWAPANDGNFDKFEEELSFSSSKFKNQLHDKNTFSTSQRWEQIALSSAQGGAAVDDALGRGVFDGRYIYFGGVENVTLIRYDTTGRFRDITSWERIGMNSAQGFNLAAGDDFRYIHLTFDGRYVYYAPVSIETMIRYDTTGVFTNITSWQQISASSASGASAAATFISLGTSFDGQYVYFSAPGASSLLARFFRFNTANSFSSITSWQSIRVSSAMGSSATESLGFQGATFDGRYVYFPPRRSDTQVRYDTTGAFTAISSWEQIAVSSTAGGTPAADMHVSCIFDGRYVHFSAFSSNTFTRFDTTGSFTDIGNWEQIGMNSATGATALDSAFSGALFDGRYIYHCAQNSDTFIRFDTTGPFTDIASWEQIAMSSAQGAAALDDAYLPGAFDGEYMYFAASNADTVIRFRANTTANKGPTEYNQVSG